MVGLEQLLGVIQTLEAVFSMQAVLIFFIHLKRRERNTFITV